MVHLFEVVCDSPFTFLKMMSDNQRIAVKGLSPFLVWWCRDATIDTLFAGEKARDVAANGIGMKLLIDGEEKENRRELI